MSDENAICKYYFRLILQFILGSSSTVTYFVLYIYLCFNTLKFDLSIFSVMSNKLKIELWILETFNNKGDDNNW